MSDRDRADAESRGADTESRGADAVSQGTDTDPDETGSLVARRRYEQVLVLARREFTTLVRTPTYAALAVVFGAVIVAIPVLGGIGGFLPLVLDLRMPIEVFVPVVAFAFGTWTVLADAERGELDVLRTYPVDRSTYVLGAYLGRATGLLLVVLVPLLVAGLVAPVLREPATSVLASHGTVDSPIYLLRFVAISGWYALATLAIAMAVSAVARSRRQGLVLAVVTVLVVVVGFDLLVLVGVGRDLLGAGTLSLALGLSPPGAFRGLVLATATGGLLEGGPPTANVAVSIVGLLAWLGLGLATAALSAWSPLER